MVWLQRKTGRHVSRHDDRDPEQSQLDLLRQPGRHVSLTPTLSQQTPKPNTNHPFPKAMVQPLRPAHAPPLPTPALFQLVSASGHRFRAPHRDFLPLRPEIPRRPRYDYRSGGALVFAYGVWYGVVAFG